MGRMPPRNISIRPIEKQYLIEGGRDCMDTQVNTNSRKPRHNFFRALPKQDSVKKFASCTWTCRQIVTNTNDTFTGANDVTFHNPIFISSAALHICSPTCTKLFIARLCAFQDLMILNVCNGKKK